jgi:hypothetical protein
LVDVGDVLQVEPVVRGPETRIELVLRRVLQPRDLRRRKLLVEDIDLAGLERLNCRRPVHDDPALDARELHVGRVTPVRILHERDRSARLSVLHLEGPVRDDVLRARPALTELLDGLLVHRQENMVRGLLDEPRLDGRESHSQRPVVDGLDADLVAERIAVLLALVVLGRALDPEQLVAVVTRQL